MRSSSIAVVLVVFAAACGGKTEERSPSPSSGSGTNAPSNAPPEEDGCARACDRVYAACTDHADARDACVRSCSADFDAPSARAYAACIEGLDCATIERGLSMDFGPLGECWAKARAH